MRIVFMGSPALAVPSLEAVRESGELVGVVSQPARKKGRGMRTTHCPVAVRAREMGIEPLTPTTIRDQAFRSALGGLAPDLAVVVAYGKILPGDVLSLPRLGCVNVHASLLPELRGAAPIQWAIARGFEATGVTLMQMDEGMDTGPILLQRSLAIGADETAGELGRRLSVMGAEVLREGLPALERGQLAAVPQDDAAATYAPLLTKEDGLIDWETGALEISRRVRAFAPWPGTFTFIRGQRMLITEATAEGDASSRPPGTVLAADRDRLTVACGTGTLRITSLQLEGRRRMTAQDFIAGHRLETGETLGIEDGHGH